MSIAGHISLPYQSNDKNLVSLIESVNNNNLYLHYSSSNSSFKQKIDELNLLFYIETERILNKKATVNNNNQCKDNLLIILFKQISLYVTEIDRLNCQLKECKENVHSLYQTTKDEKIKRRNEIGTKDKIISTLRASIVVLEESLLSQLKRDADTTLPLNNNNSYQRPIKLSIENYSFNLNGNKRRRLENAIGRNGYNNQSDSIIMNSSLVHNNKKQLTNDCFMRQYSNGDNKNNELHCGLNFQLIKQKINNTNGNVNNESSFIKKRRNIKIIKELKEAISKSKADSSELISSERESKNSNHNQDIKTKTKKDSKIPINILQFHRKNLRS